jgi:hypothetical protein
VLTSFLNGKTADNSENNVRNFYEKLSRPHFFSLNALSVSASENQPKKSEKNTKLI